MILMQEKSNKTLLTTLSLRVILTVLFLIVQLVRIIRFTIKKGKFHA